MWITRNNNHLAIFFTLCEHYIFHRSQLCYHGEPCIYPDLNEFLTTKNQRFHIKEDKIVEDLLL